MYHIAQMPVINYLTSTLERQILSNCIYLAVLLVFSVILRLICIGFFFTPGFPKTFGGADAPGQGSALASTLPKERKRERARERREALHSLFAPRRPTQCSGWALKPGDANPSPSPGEREREMMFHREGSVDDPSHFTPL